MRPHILQNKEKEKFLFDLNVFDEDEEDQEVIDDDLPPPPPTFSEEELEAAKKQAFDDGRKQGIEETENSIARDAELQLKALAQHFKILFLAEDEREQRYEQEAVHLTLKIFEKLFPLYQDNYGFDQLKSYLSDALKQQEQQHKIVIQVHPDLAGLIEDHLKNVHIYEDRQVFDVRGLDNISKGSYEMFWSDGGAVRNADALADQIKEKLEVLLAGRSATGHDDSGEHSHDHDAQDDQSVSPQSNLDNGIHDKHDEIKDEQKTEPEK